MRDTGWHRAAIAVLAGLTLLATACGEETDPGAALGEGDEEDTGDAGEETGDTGEETGDADPDTLRLYTTVTEDTVEAVVAGFEEQHPDVETEVFRAPTGEFNARVATERREGRIRADVFWLTDPLSMQPFEEEGLLAEWSPAEVGAVPEEYRASTFWGTRVLNLVIVHADDAEPAPESWWDLADPAHGEVALPDPGFAGSAFAALGYFALDPDYGMDYYRELDAAGATQVQAPGEVVTGVAEGQFAAGITLDKAARDAIEDGSPIGVAWPEPGAIAVYSPIAVLAGSGAREPAEAFVDHVLSAGAQEAIAATGWQPVRDDVDWPHQGGPLISPDWSAAFDRQEELLEEYRSVFGG